LGEKKEGGDLPTRRGAKTFIKRKEGDSNLRVISRKEKEE